MSDINVTLSNGESFTVGSVGVPVTYVVGVQSPAPINVTTGVVIGPQGPQGIQGIQGQQGVQGVQGSLGKIGRAHV